jgi:transcriptional regulator
MTALPLLQGTLDLLVLKALAAGPAHGYAVAESIRAASDEAFQIEDGALYTSLKRMQKRDWLTAEWGVSESNRRAKYYELTARGREELRRSRRQWDAYTSAVAKVLTS